MSKKSHTGEKIAAGFGAAAAVAAIAGAIFLYGTKEGVKHKKKIKSWALKMKGEVLEKLENLKDVSEEKYKKAVDDVAKRYERVKTIDSSELKAAVDDLKRHWKNIKTHIDGKPKKRKRS